jgi:hypothetical protein
MIICDGCGCSVEEKELEFDYSSLIGHGHSERLGGRKMEVEKKYFIITYYKTFSTWKVVEGLKDLIEPFLENIPFELGESEYGCGENELGVYRVYISASNPGDALNLGQKRIEEFLKSSPSEKWAVLSLRFNVQDGSLPFNSFKLSMAIEKIFDNIGEANDYVKGSDKSNIELINYQVVKLPVF